MTWVYIDKYAGFAPNVGVMVDESILELDAQAAQDVLALAFKHWQDDLLVDACCGGSGPFSAYGDLSID